MYHFLSSFTALFFLFFCALSAQDSLSIPDSTQSDTAIHDTLLLDSILQDSTSISGDISFSDTSQEDGTETEIESVQGDDSTSEGLAKEISLFSKNDREKAALKDSVWQNKSIRSIVRKIKGVVNFFAHYFIHIFFLAISCGIILYTIMFFQKKNDDKRFLTSTRLSIMDKQVRIACKYMESHFDDPGLSVETICEDLVTGPAFLEALFDRELGMSVPDFLSHIRINRVKDILEKEPGITVDELAGRVGYIDTTLFIKHFKEINGIDFKEYRESVQ